MSTLVVHRLAARYLQRLSSPQRARIKESPLRLANDPLGFPGAVRMAGEWEGYSRIRIGDFRVIYWYDGDEDVIYVDHVGPRGDIYRQ